MLVDIAPDAQTLLQLEPEELAGILLEHLRSIGSPHFNRHSFGQPDTVTGYPDHLKSELLVAFMGAWAWLEREGILTIKPGSDGHHFVFSRRSRRLANRADVDAYRRAGLLKRDLLHPQIDRAAWPSFARGDYDASSFLALKEVEVAIRERAGLGPELYGVPLVRKAFDPLEGPLTAESSLPAEREALANLFAGAIGSYKNPHSHRRVAIDVTEAAEIIVLASHLLKIVESRGRVA